MAGSWRGHLYRLSIPSKSPLWHFQAEAVQPIFAWTRAADPGHDPVLVDFGRCRRALHWIREESSGKGDVLGAITTLSKPIRTPVIISSMAQLITAAHLLSGYARTREPVPDDAIV